MNLQEFSNDNKQALQIQSAASNPSITDATTATVTTRKKLTLLPLVFLIYFQVAGGPYGEEPAVQAAGSLFAIIGFIVFPFLWSVPEALITAELATTFPGNGGFVIWAERAFGPFCGSLMGTWKIFSGIMNITAFPAFFISYVEKIFPALESGWPRRISIFISTILLSLLNYVGLTIVGYVAIVLAFFSLLPFILMTLMAMPKIRPRRWFSSGENVENPHKTYPVALFVSVIFISLSYIIPLLAVVGAVPVEQTAWGSGFHAQAAQFIAGNWLKIILDIGAGLSAIGMYEAQLSSSAYQILGMAEIGILPRFFASRAKVFETPWIGILICTVVSLGASYMQFYDIVASANFIYSLGMLLEFTSFLWLRWKQPELRRPFKVPMELPWLVVMCLFPIALLVVLMILTHKTVLIVSAIMTSAGTLWYFLMKLCKKKKIFKFNDSPQIIQQSYIEISTTNHVGTPIQSDVVQVTV
ncbi:putative polyamine transporter [Cucumis melo var. makuwa]|uniref:Putative polyamine transporter n=1 Tax=Cucumis melo var. makuwa TaxID=1194695 RepID=A0A5D3DDX3_CUCMM|nr:putative polyamine transporter [Cucumis melo var. makuwa]